MSDPRRIAAFHEGKDDPAGASRAFCLMPWIHFYVSPRGRVLPCCSARDPGSPSFGDINRQSFDEIWNGEAVRRFRLKMLRDEPEEGCSGCYEVERHGGLSTRQAINKLYRDKLDWARRTDAEGFSAEAQPVYWDIRFSNRCNLRCRICSHFSSSAWHKEAKELGQIDPGQPAVIEGVEDAEALLRRLELLVPTVDQIYFAGGEPLFMEEHYRLLELLERHGKYDVWLRYNTNFSTLTRVAQGSGDALGERSVLKLWKKFPRVTVAASLDASGERGELQRKGLDWSRVVENRRTMVEECPHVEFLVALTVSVFSVYSVPDFHRELTESKFMDVAYLWPRVLRQPEEYSIQILPARLKEEIAFRYERHLEWVAGRDTDDPERKSLMVEQLRSIPLFMNAADRSDLLGRFRARCDALDRLRSERTAEVMPELEPLWARR